jgi:tol-pal system protein YbgF
MRKQYRISLLLSVLLISACATTHNLEVVQGGFDKKNEAIEKEIGALRNQIQSLKETTDGLAEETKTLTKNSEEIRQIMAGADADITAIRQELEEFSGKMDLQQRNTDDMGKNLIQLNSRMTFVEKYLDTGKDKEASSPSGGSDRQAREVQGLMDSDAAYEAALNSFKEEKFEKARNEFEKFLVQYSNVEKAGHAQYWIGECLYEEGHLEQAILAYDKVIKNYSTGSRVPFALYKEGLCFSKLGDAVTAKLLFQRVVQDYPDASPATIARIKLKEME